MHSRGLIHEKYMITILQSLEWNKWEYNFVTFLYCLEVVGYLLYVDCNTLKS